MNGGTNTIRCARADFEESFGVKTDPKSIGARLVSHDGQQVLTEYVFMSEQAEVEFLEDLFTIRGEQ